MIKKVLCFLFGHRIYRPVQNQAVLHFSLNDGREIFIDMCERCKHLFYSELRPLGWSREPEEIEEENDDEYL